MVERKIKLTAKEDVKEFVNEASKWVSCKIKCDKG